MHLFGMWEEAGVLGGNPHGHREDVQTPHIQATGLTLLSLVKIMKVEQFLKNMLNMMSL